jgi:hypothetical protein
VVPSPVCSSWATAVRATIAAVGFLNISTDLYTKIEDIPESAFLIKELFRPDCQLSIDLSIDGKTHLGHLDLTRSIYQHLYSTPWPQITLDDICETYSSGLLCQLLASADNTGASKQTHCVDLQSLRPSYALRSGVDKFDTRHAD